MINNPTYSNLRGNIIDDAVAHKALFDSLSTIGQLPETHACYPSSGANRAED